MKKRILQSLELSMLSGTLQGVRMGKFGGAKIVKVELGSIGAELDLEPGDVLCKINGVAVSDLIDYLMLCAEEDLKLEVGKTSGEIQEIHFRKELVDPLGLVFEAEIFDGIKTCTNHCIFCFVRQMPLKLRPSLYIRDDDYRLSFLQGSYITLTNLSEADWQKIEKWRLSPLYISVHATQPEVRKQLLGCRDSDIIGTDIISTDNIMEQLHRLAKAGITMHTQAVICPGINDGPVLERTIRDLSELWPSVASLAIVPVGLTKERRNLFKLEPFNKQDSIKVLKTIKLFQTNFIKMMGFRFVFAADEWYILAGNKFPVDGEYEDYLQLDNGVGLVRRFLTDFTDAFQGELPQLKKLTQKLVVVTGKATRRLWGEVQRRFSTNCPGLKLEILEVANLFFGPTVTVTGLLAGNDIIKSICNHPADAASRYLIPRITLKHEENIFLDDVSVDDLKKACYPKRIEIVPSNAADWIDWLIQYRIYGIQDSEFCSQNTE
jgi:putative radical SAM enzyme (TIGR03279 family)